MERPGTCVGFTCAAVAVVAALAESGPQPIPPRNMVVVAGNGTPGFADGVGAAARFNKPIRLAPFGPDAILVSDIFNHAIRIVTSDGHVTTLAGAPDRKGHQDGPASTARFASPHGVAVSPDGRIAVAEAEGHTLRLITRNAGGAYEVSTLAGAPGVSGPADGPVKDARFNSPHAVLWDDDGSLYTPDIGNAAIRRVRDGRVTTVAGMGAEKLVYPMDIAWMKGGMVIADAGANQLRTWQPVPPAAPPLGGEVLGTLTIRGKLATPHGVTGGPDGTVYVADMKSHRVLFVDRDGALQTVAGIEGEAGSDARHLNRPAAVLVHAGWLWIADLDNHRICAVSLAR